MHRPPRARAGSAALRSISLRSASHAALAASLVSAGLAGPAASQTGAAQTGALQTGSPATAATTGDEALTLDVIDVYGAAGTTEGTGSYASEQASIARGAESLREVPQTVTIVTQQTLQDQNLNTLDQAMGRTPGIVARSGGYGFPEFFSRGFIIDNYQVDQLSTSFTSGFRPDFDMAIFDRLEVLRGSEALFSGSGEPGGVINLVRKRPTGAFQASGALTSGSWDNYRGEADISGPITPDGRLRGRVVGVLQDQEFFYSPSDERREVAYGILEYDLTPSTLLSGGASWQRQNGVTWQSGLPTYTDGSFLDIARETALTADWTNREQTIKEYFGSVEHAINPDWTVKLSGMRQDFDFDYLDLGVSGPVDPETGAFASVFNSSERDGNTSKVADLNVTGRFQAWGQEHGLVLGADWRESYGKQMRYLVEPSTVPGSLTIHDFPDPRLPKPRVGRLDHGWPEWGAKQEGVYARLDLAATDRIGVTLGGRYGEYHQTETFESYDENGDVTERTVIGYDDDAFVPYAGVTYTLTQDWTLYGSVADTYVPQGNYLSGPPDDMTPLDPITGRTWEVGAKGLLMDGALNASVSLYRIERDGEAVEDARYGPSYADGDSCCYVAQGEVVSQGVELELAGEIRPGWQVFGGYTYNSNENKTEDAVYSEFTPRHLVTIWTSYDLPRDWSRWTIGGGVTAMSSQSNSGLAWIYDPVDGWAQEPFSIEQGGYAVWDGFVRYRIAEDWDLALNVNNVFDRTYYATLGDPRNGNWYGEPRSAYLTLRARF